MPTPMPGSTTCIVLIHRPGLLGWSEVACWAHARRKLYEVHAGMGSLVRNAYGLAAANCGIQFGRRQFTVTFARTPEVFGRVWALWGGLVPRNESSQP